MDVLACLLRTGYASFAIEEFLIMPTFVPKLETLPKAQQEIWPHLKPAIDLGFVLYGGTAIALQLGHRESVD